MMSIVIKEMQEALKQDFEYADKMMFAIMVLLWFIGSFITSQTYGMYSLGIVSGGLLVLIVGIGLIFYRGTAFSRILFGIAFMGMSAIYIQQQLGRIEMHFYVFVLIGILSFYKDQWAVISAGVTTTLYHIIGNILQTHDMDIFGLKVYIFNYGCGWDIVFIHAVAVVLEMIVMSYIIYLSKRRFIMLIRSNLLLEAQRKENDNLLDSFNQYVIATKTDSEGIITYVSDAYLKVTGYSKKELLGQMHKIVRHPDTDNELYKDLWRHIAWGEEWEGDLKNIKKDGSYFWVHTHITPEVDNQGTITGFHAISEDITSKKDLTNLTKNQEVVIKDAISKDKEKTMQMLHQSRLAQMGEMISMIAHQWRQPLAAITTTVGTLKIQIMMNGYDESYFYSKADAILDITDHLSETINDFRNFFKESKETKVVTFEEIVLDCLNIIGSDLEAHNITIATEYNSFEKFETFSNEIKQVILNILKNAEDVLIENEIINPVIKLTAYENSTHVSLSIEDNGGGVPAEIMDTIFDPYFSTKKDKEGTGLGLYMSKTIIKDHCHGSLTVENTNDGAKFLITLEKDDSKKKRFKNM